MTRQKKSPEEEGAYKFGRKSRQIIIQVSIFPQSQQV